ncbi:hypothetical protein CDL12_27601 [Handroanthus impetiginosus]|uniref:BED-type domain-containing protein n=1 Tax=Handroanthus impetiginosus TaxID=429701 RepID=A0A2G9G3M0_9LAMI|nr:hypothetical protein CDL12_27601 [Handroanthus impetiginosus]
MGASSTSSNRKDPAWKYVRLENFKNTCNTTYIFCDLKCSGRICRAKQHIVGGYRNVKACDKRAKEQVIIEKQIQQQSSQEEYLKSLGIDDEEEEQFEGLSREAQSKKKAKTNTKGPMDFFISHG